MKNTSSILLIISTICLPEILHSSTTELTGIHRQIQSEQLNDDVVTLRIPEYLDLKGEKLNSFLEMIKERISVLNANKLKRNEIYKRYFWILGVILPAYALASIIWTSANIIFYKRQKRKLENDCEGHYVSKKNKERQRLLERYNQVPSVNLPLVNPQTLPVAEFSDENDLTNEFRHSAFQANRARVEVVLKLNNEPQFMKQI